MDDETAGKQNDAADDDDDVELGACTASATTRAVCSSAVLCSKRMRRVAFRSVRCID